MLCIKNFSDYVRSHLVGRNHTWIQYRLRSSFAHRQSSADGMEFCPWILLLWDTRQVWQGRSTVSTTLAEYPGRRVAGSDTYRIGVHVAVVHWLQVWFRRRPYHNGIIINIFHHGRTSMTNVVIGPFTCQVGHVLKRIEAAATATITTRSTKRGSSRVYQSW